MTTVPNKNTRYNPQKKNLEENNKTTLNQLVQRPGITIKKKVVLKNLQKNDNLSTKTKSQAKLTNLQTKVSNSPTKMTNSPTKMTSSPTKMTNSPTKMTNTQNKITNSQRANEKEKKELKSKNTASKKKNNKMEKFMLLQNVEFYPDLRKRNARAKKIKLQPKHHYKVVATTNKRKRGIPHKGTYPSLPRHTSSLQSDPHSPAGPKPSAVSEPLGELSMSELVRLADEQGLDDEDFMEILTCPSPVWWEDSDEDDIYFNEDINQYRRESDNKSNKDANGNKISVENNKPSRNDNVLKKFAAKRSKIEGILNKIKNKNTESENTISRGHIELGKSNINNRENILKGNNNIDCNTVKVVGTVSNAEDYGNNIDESTIANEFSNRARKTSLGGLSDVSLNEDELLHTLESIEIPIKDTNDEQDVKNATNSDVIMMDIENLEMDMKFISNKKKNLEKLKSSLKYDKKIEPEAKISVKKNVVVLNNETDTNIPSDLPILTKYPFETVPKAYESPISIGSPYSETMSFAESDSISDTNIKFLDEYVDDKKETEAVNINKYKKGKDGELVTVYQIVTNKPNEPDIDAPDNGMDLDVEAQIKVNLVNKSLQSDDDSKITEFVPISTARKPTFRSRSKYKRK